MRGASRLTAGGVGLLDGIVEVLDGIVEGLEPVTSPRREPDRAGPTRAHPWLRTGNALREAGLRDQAPESPPPEDDP